ncbi:MULTISPECIES: hypothetical protein [Geobacillus]|uniref:Uncharacterized protein n=1 Tax=Bacillus caldolyticus TaxID=1394 RepID=A0ABM6QQL0_BACCL|nr:MULTISPECIES: hypothetical protein [Geobacillus]AMV11708.1 hypothetical protein GT3570_12315 [Geobacillus thermoleovorans]AUI37771.1 hypothetical protein CWI35_15705 [[Bacillus] caldolyticus]
MLKLFKQLDFWLSLVMALCGIALSYIIVPYLFPDVMEGMFATCLLTGLFIGEFLGETKHLMKAIINERIATKEHIHEIRPDNR